MTPLLHESVDEVPKRPRVVALGTFDGVHFGHRRVIAAAVERARALGIPAMVATFHPRPVTVLVPDRAPEALSTVGRRIELLGEAGADEVVVIRFDLELASLDADEFCEQILSRRLGAQVVVTGCDFHFGHARTGTPETLAMAGAELGFETIAVPLFEHDGERVSSTRIRALIAGGDVEGAAQLLGRAPEVEGTVIHGDARGRELGVPTANLALAAGHVLPAQGVYAGVATLPDDAGLRRAAISVGTNPTFAGERELRIEAHLLDFDADLYGRPLRLSFRRFLRGQVAFDDLAALERQMQADIAEARDEPLEDSRRIAGSYGDKRGTLHRVRGVDGRGVVDVHLASRVRAVTGGYVLECETDEDGRLRLVVAVPGARRPDVARTALRDLSDLAAETDAASLDLLLIDPNDATVELKHQLELPTAAPARVA